MMQALTLDQFATHLRTLSIEEAYRWFEFDYADEATYDTHQRASSARRDRFLGLFAWRIDPSTEIIRRLFNQTNTYYAERRFEEEPFGDPIGLLTAGNQLCLFRQGKPVGYRRRDISFGVRVHLEPRDAFRGAKWLYGVAPEFIESAVLEWTKTLEHCRGSEDLALALALAFIVIHPFSDANGRIGRLIFTWLCRCWRLPVRWLAEADDGELLRTGQGIRSTEYLMAMFMIKLAHQRNIVDPGGWRAPNEKRDMFEAICTELARMGMGELALLQSDEFKDLKTHLVADRHFRDRSPRFECLRSSIF